MYQLGHNAYKNADDSTRWFNDPNDPQALQRVYANLVFPFPYYDYPVLIHGQNSMLARDSSYQEHALFEIQFNELMRNVKILAEYHQENIEFIEVMGAFIAEDEFGEDNIDNEDDVDNEDNEDNEDIEQDENKKVNVVELFTENVLCGFNGITRGKFATQSDPQLFADLKEYVEIILNAMLKDIPLAKGTLRRFIAAISACEGGAWADLKIMATEIRPIKGIFGVSEKSRERIANCIAFDHIAKHQDDFDRDYIIQTHVNVFVQVLLALLGKLRKPSLKDVNIPKIKLSHDGAFKVLFLDNYETQTANRLFIYLTTMVGFEERFDNDFQFPLIVKDVADHLIEQINIIYQEYQKIVTEAVRTTGLDPETYLNTVKHASNDMIKHSLSDAKDDCIKKIKFLLNSFDTPDTACSLILDEQFEHPNKILTLKSLEMRQYWCHAFAAHNIKLNHIINGFHVEPLPEHSDSDTSYVLASTDDRTIQWIENAAGTFISPYDFLTDNPKVHTYLIHNAATQCFLVGFQDAIAIYRFFMSEPDAFAEDLKLIRSRYFMQPEFKLFDKKSEIDNIIQSDDIDKLIGILKCDDVRSSLMAQNIISDLIGRSYWEEDQRFEIIELMLKACPDMRTALSHEQEKELVEWAIPLKTTKDLLCNLVQHSISLHITFSLEQFKPMEMKLPLLHAVTFHEYEEIIAACLIREDLDINDYADEKWGYPTVLHMGVVSENLKIVGILLTHNNIQITIALDRKDLSTPVEYAMKNNNVPMITLLLSHQPFQSVLKLPYLLELRDTFGLTGLFSMLNIDIHSAEAYQLWGKTTVMRLEKELSDLEDRLSPTASQLSFDKITAITQAIKGTDTDAMFNAITMPSGTPLSLYWIRDPASSPNLETKTMPSGIIRKLQ